MKNEVKDLPKNSLIKDEKIKTLKDELKKIVLKDRHFGREAPVFYEKVSKFRTDLFNSSFPSIISSSMQGNISSNLVIVPPNIETDEERLYRESNEIFERSTNRIG